VFAFACAPSDVIEAKEKMNKEGYAIVDYTGTVSSSNGYVGGIIATKDFTASPDKVKTLTAILFDSKDSAKAYLETISETSAKRVGRWIVWGDEESVSIFD
jgi:hypothetical protein